MLQLISRRSLTRTTLLLALAVAPIACAPHRDAASTMPASTMPTTRPMDPITARIRDEGLNHSKVMDTLDYLCNVIGPRLTGSPNCKRASEWTRDTLSKWGMDDAHLEAWGPFGRGWELKRFSMQIVEPQTIVLHGYPRAWSPGFDEPLKAEVVYLDATRASELEKYRGQLKGKIVLIGAPRDVDARFEPLATRLKDDDLDKLAGANPNSESMLGSQPRTQTPGERRAQFAAAGPAGERLLGGRGTTRPATEPGARPTRGEASTQPFGNRGPTSRNARRGGPGGGMSFFAPRALQFAADEGAALIVTASVQGDGGTIFVQSASIPGDNPFGGGFGGRGAGRGGATRPSSQSTTAEADDEPTTLPTREEMRAMAATQPARPHVYDTNAPKIPPQLTLAVEDYNRLVHMLKLGEKLTAAADLEVKWNDDDPMSYNTIAEIPGGDLKDEVVMVGAHLDSWHSGTGATDNGVGSASAMEAIRILRTLNLHPRRTIRVALWTGEEEGIFGSSAYVKKHFGYTPEPTTQETLDAAAARRAAGVPGPDGGEGNPATRPAIRRPAPHPLIKLGEYEKLSAYFNLDNGSGKIRGIYAQGNTAAVPLFKQWLEPFWDLGAKTVTLSNTGSTDHIPFDSVGLPGFQFIQDPIEYGSRTHHSNEDVYDRAQADDLKQASTIMASFLWNAANMDARFPRKPATTQPSER